MEDEFNFHINKINSKLSVFQLKIFQDYVMIFAEPVNNNVGGVAMFIKNNYKISEREDLKIAYSTKVKLEDLWVEIAKR